MSDSSDRRCKAMVSGCGGAACSRLGCGPDGEAIRTARLQSSKGPTSPREGPPLHRPNQHDGWRYIGKGEYRFEIDGEEIFASAAATVYAPLGTRFQNVGSARGLYDTTVIPVASTCSLRISKCVTLNRPIVSTNGL
jgi:hypothetical protein